METTLDDGSPCRQTVLSAINKNRPYAPGWINQLTGWVRQLPLPAWMFYLAVAIGLTLVRFVTQWAGGVLPATPEALWLYLLLSAMTIAYLLALVHYLDDWAAAALTRFRPVMTVDEAGFHNLCYRLTTLPARSTWFASALGAAYAIAAIGLNIATDSKRGIEIVSVVAIAVDVLLSVMTYVIVGVTVYHTLHQLRMVNQIYTRHTRINLFQLGPLYTLSNLTARTAIGLAIPTFLWFQINILSAARASAADIFQSVFLGIMVIITFIAPLVGAHNLLEREKQRLQDEVARHIEHVIQTLNSRVAAGALADNSEIKATLDSLVAEQQVIRQLRTWPWRTETVSSVALAFIVPIIIWIVQRVLERLGI
jgi:hypothetical protein